MSAANDPTPHMNLERDERTAGQTAGPVDSGMGQTSMSDADVDSGRSALTHDAATLTTEPMAPEAVTAGALLGAARTHIGLSVGEVASHLKLSIRQVEAMEADAFERLPSPMFVRGFAKSYARLVQIDPGPVLQALESGIPAEPAGAAASRAAATRARPLSAIPVPSSDQPSRRLHAVAALLAAVVVGFLAFEWLAPQMLGPGEGLPAQAVGVERPGIVASPALESVAPPVTARGPAESVPAGAAAPGVGTAPAAASPAAVSPAAVSPAEGGVSTAPRLAAGGSAAGEPERTIRLAFDRESWVEIRDGRGKLIFSQLNPPGSSQVVQGEAPLSLIVGNARGVRMAYQDREIDLGPYTRVDVARFTLE